MVSLPLSEAPDLGLADVPGLILVTGLNFGTWNMSRAAGLASSGAI